jgi:hypothetical protein
LGILWFQCVPCSAFPFMKLCKKEIQKDVYKFRYICVYNMCIYMCVRACNHHELTQVPSRNQLSSVFLTFSRKQKQYAVD